MGLVMVGVYRVMASLWASMKLVVALGWWLHFVVVWFSFQDSQKDMSIVELPEVLCIHLKRFRYDAYISTNKISRHIKFPLTGLSMVPFLKQGSAAGGGQGGGHIYNLDAVITHYGGAGGEGHLVCVALVSHCDEGGAQFLHSSHLSL